MERKGGKLQLIGQGSNSEIYLYGEPEKGVVLKVVSAQNRKQAKHLTNEYTMLKELSHDNIVKCLKYQENISLLGTGQNKQLRCVRNVLVIQNAKHGNLLNFYQKYRPDMEEVRWVMGEACEAIRYLHGRFIAHRDLKLENFLVTSINSKVQVKLADFGFASCVRDEKTKWGNTVKGTRKAYMAPEIHQLFQHHNLTYEIVKTDIFSLGVLMFTIVLGRLPFEYAQPRDQHYRLIAEGKFQDFWKLHSSQVLRAENLEYSMISEFKVLFQSMVNIDPSKRPNIQEVCDSVWLRGQKKKIILPESWKSHQK